ncbi:MAG: 3,4-dihydroxyphenylacetate 2,3-dioxygenase, partial [Acidimicrobiales bacterium]
DHPIYRWDIRDPRRRDFWGGAVIPSWYNEATPVLSLDGKLQPTTEIAQPAEVTVGADGLGTFPPD